MRNATLITLAFMVLSSFYDKHQNNKKNGIECILTTAMSTYKIGQIPEFKVSIINKSNDEIWLIGSLDGSEQKMSMPYCYFTIEKPVPDTLRYSMCGTLNPLRVKDFVVIKQNESFNPFEKIDDYGFFRSYEIIKNETFKNPGTYRIHFHYSTKSKDASDFLGNVIWSEENDIRLQKALFLKVPKIDLVSNTVEVRIEK